jgi:SAM-dependent methyltransferase
MSTGSEEPTPSLAFMQAMQDVSETFEGHEALALVRGAWRLGLMQAAARPAAVPELAGRVGVPVDHAERVLVALLSFGVVDLTDDLYVISERWRALLLESPPIDVLELLRFRQARSRMIEDAVVGNTDYWTSDDDDRSAYALGVSVNPESAHSVELLRTAMALDPALHALAEKGGTYLELGCGVTGAMCTILQIYPGLRGVGVELSEPLVAIARDRIRRLGLEDRMEVVHGDAAAFDRPEAFDLAFWSQFFFAEGARADAVAVLFRSLRSGGIVSAPLMAEPVSGLDELRTVDGRDYALDALLHGSWGVPDRGAQALQDELTAGGFADAAFTELPFARVVRARKP